MIFIEYLLYQVLDKNLDYALGTENFCIFALGAEAAFYWCLPSTSLALLQQQVERSRCVYCLFWTDAHCDIACWIFSK